MSTIDEYKELFDLYQIDINTRKSKIPDCSFSYIIRDGIFVFRLTHKVGLDNIYEISNISYIINKNKQEKYTYTMSFKSNITSNKILPIEDVIDKFKNIKYVDFYNYLMINFDITKNYEFIPKIDENLEKFSINHGNNRVDFFRFKHPDCKFPRYIIHIKYMDKWFKIVSGDENVCKTTTYLTSYVGDNMPKEYFHFTNKINYFSYENIIHLFNEESFNEVMSNIDTEIVFS